MIRTQVSLEESSYRAAQREAKRRGMSLAAFVREALAAALARTDRARNAGSGSDGKAWMRYSGSFASGDPRASETVDEVVYGRDAP